MARAMLEPSVRSLRISSTRGFSAAASDCSGASSPSAGPVLLKVFNADGSVRLLTGIELARPDDPADPRQLARVLPEAAGTLELGEPLEAAPWCGSRPSTPDGLPVVGRAPRHPRLIFAFGHGHIGLSTGPITGRLVADLLDGMEPPLPLAPYAPQRF